jgi:hypothetical protein
LGSLGVVTLEFPERLIQGKQFLCMIVAGQFELVEIEPLVFPPALERCAGSGALDQDPPHGLGRGSEEVSPAVPLLSLGVLADEPQVGFMDQGRGLEHLPGLFVGQATYQATIQRRTDAAQAAFPPSADPQAGTPLQNKGPDEHTILTVNGRISLSRRPYAATGVGSSYPFDAWLDRAADSLSLGLRALACRLKLASRNFDKAAANLGRASQVHLSGEFLRQVVESEGKAVQAAAQAVRLAIDWQADACPALDKEGQATERSRIYLGSDGVMVPHITDAEKRTRRDRTRAKCRCCGKKRRALPKAKSGTFSGPVDKRVNAMDSLRGAGPVVFVV